jgi:hypothetical protein
VIPRPSTSGNSTQVKAFGISITCSPEWTKSKIQKFIRVDKELHLCRGHGIWFLFSCLQ